MASRELPRGEMHRLKYTKRRRGRKKYERQNGGEGCGREGEGKEKSIFIIMNSFISFNPIFLSRQTIIINRTSDDHSSAASRTCYASFFFFILLPQFCSNVCLSWALCVCFCPSRWFALNILIFVVVAVVVIDDVHMSTSFQSDLFRRCEYEDSRRVCLRGRERERLHSCARFDLTIRF